ncbi:unnamed protein product, partial [Sphagnum compactum]
VKATILMGKHVLDYASIKQLTHLKQVIMTGRFAMYDYGADNLKFYNVREPPEYNLDAIDIPITVRGFENDLL